MAERQWEQVESVPGARAKPPILRLEPGETRRAVADTRNESLMLRHQFSRRGYLDQHAVSRQVDGVLYTYIWRDQEGE